MTSFKVKKWDFTIVIDGTKYDVTSYLVIVPNGIVTAYGKMDAAIHCHNEEGDEINSFNTYVEAREWIDHYGDAVDIRIEHGDEIHAYPRA